MKLEYLATFLISIKNIILLGLFHTLNDLLTSAGAELVDTTKTVHELLFGFKDPIFVELANRLAGS